MHSEKETILRSVVDRLAHVKATIATLQDEEATLRAVLADSGCDSVMGSTHRATVSHCEGKVVTDWRSVAAHLKPSRQLVTAHTAQGEPYTVVRLSAHKTSK